jgi:hypothetical protein
MHTSAGSAEGEPAGLSESTTLMGADPCRHAVGHELQEGGEHAVHAGQSAVTQGAAAYANRFGTFSLQHTARGSAIASGFDLVWLQGVGHSCISQPCAELVRAVRLALVPSFG